MSWTALAFAGLFALQAPTATAADAGPAAASGDYEDVSARAVALFYENAYAQVQEACVAMAPRETDLEYRFACLSSNEADPAPTIPGLFDLHVDALAADHVDLAAMALSVAAWRQSASGDIRGAFATFERAMLLAGHASPEVLNDITLNTASLYAMHGDPEYVSKGVELQQLAIARYRELKETRPEGASSYDFGIALSQHNAGIAYALHLADYERALHWFGQVDPAVGELRHSTLVFSALSAAELGRVDQARRWLSESLDVPAATGMETSYLACYQQLVRVKLDGAGDLAPCRTLGEHTPLEVSLDLYKRLSSLSVPEWRLLGLEGLRRLFVDTLESQLKQSSMHAASRTELSRLQMEAKLQDELVEKERALKRAQQQRLVSLQLLGGALVAILLLVLLVIILRLRHNRKLAGHFRAMSIHDSLTGLHNRRYFEQNIEREVSQARRAQREGTPRTLAICMLDVDHFKRINDTYGHDAGDAVLVELARRLKAVTRDSDILVRWGGEEFVLMTCMKEPGEARAIIERGRSVVADQPFLLPGGVAVDVTCTLGAVVYPRIGDGAVEVSWQRLVQLADAALYLGKQEGRNRWVCVGNVLDAAVLEEDAGVSLAELERGRRVSIVRSVEHAPSGATGPEPAASG